MQTLTFQVQDDFIPSLLNYLEQFKDKIKLKQDKNLEYDLYFYERQEELNLIRNGIKNGTSQLISLEDFENQTVQFEKELELKYAN